MATLQDIKQNKLNYFIHKCSSHTVSYSPENIQENKPHDPSSRWCSNTSKPPQYLILKLQKVSIVTRITFGKFERPHACNIKRFKVLGGLLEDNLLELLESGLKNDSTPETFELRHEIGGRPLPSRFIKIVPFLSWTPSSNFSIWFVELFGVDEWAFVKPCIEWFHVYRERELVRHCLKHFRDMRYTRALEALANETGVQLEVPALTHLHEVLVERGDFEGVERIMGEAVASGTFSGYSTQQDYIPEWNPVPETSVQNVSAVPGSTPAEGLRPGMRGGHQMCLDQITETIYLLGGWDGNQDLSDFWSYHIPSRKWTLISRNTRAQGGPSARSCHKVCLDPERRQIFTLGRYLDPQYRYPQNLKSDFYRYDIDANSWTLITDDTASVGGPHLIFDHQMCMDVEQRKIHVFGGRLLTSPAGLAEERSVSVQPTTPPEVEFSGLYTYEVATNSWTKVWDDSVASEVPVIKSRVGHSMVFHPISRKLFIFAGQRGKEYLNDFFTLDVDTRQIQAVNEWTSSSNDDVANQGSNCGPAAGFTRRATIDPDLDEIYVLSGMCKEKGKRGDNVHNSFWVYYIKKKEWLCVYRNEDMAERGDGQKNAEPCPRFAHQLVYDPVSKVHYLFGGNPGRITLPTLRLDDFWSLSLRKPTQADLIHTITLMIRKHRFVELASQDKLAALEYLQTELADIVDHNDISQIKEFQQLPSVLFQSQEGDGCEVDMNSDEGSNATFSQRQQQRSALFHKLMAFFPASMTEPKSCLLDLIPL